jgi:hypothetical protein
MRLFYKYVYLMDVLTGIKPFVFRLPPDKVEVHEPVEHRMYDAAYRSGLSNQDCSDTYSDCPFSLIDVFLGIHQNE